MSYLNNIAEVNMITGEAKRISIHENIKKQFLGGRGLGIRLLWEMTSPEMDAFSPENPLMFLTGPYTGTGVFSGFYNVTTLSPLTGSAVSAHSGGSFGPTLKKAGYDGLVVVGRADKPTYILLDNGKVSLKDAGHLWGMDVEEAEKALKETHGDVEVAVIGPAGENLVRFGCIMNNVHRAAGRGGAGAVMGSKKLKAVVVKGDQKPKYHDRKAFNAISKQVGKKATETGSAFGKYGTPIAYGMFAQKGTLPTLHFRQGFYDDWEKLSGDLFKEKYFMRDQGCYNCPLRCANIHRIPSGPYTVASTEGPEYETIMAFGPLCGISNPEAVTKAGHLANLLGMDTISGGVAIAFAMDLVDLGLLSKNETDGLDLSFGNEGAMLEMIPRIANRQGFGDLLAEGTLRAGKQLGPQAEARVMTCMGQELPGYEPRRAPATGFSLASSTRGACHLRATYYVNEIFGGEFQGKDFADHMDLLVSKEHLMAVADSLVICKFGQRMGGFTLDLIADALRAATGLDFTADDVVNIGERTYNLERLLNIRRGKEEITLPNRCFSEPIEDGFGKTPPIDRKHFEKAKNRYFAARGWDDRGRPRKQKLEQLQLIELVG